MAVMLITHDLGVVAEVAQRVVVMYAGKVVEEAPVRELFAHPRHPYTQGLIRSIPRIDLDARHKVRLEAIPGTVPKLIEPAGRLPLRRALQACRAPHACQATPPLREVAPGHQGGLHPGSADVNAAWLFRRRSLPRGTARSALGAR